MAEENLTEIKEQLRGLAKRILVLEGFMSPGQEIIKEQMRSKNLSLREFMNGKNPTNDVQRTLVIGYYLEHYKKMNSFNIKDIEGEFRSAKIVPPSNINDKVNMNIKNTHIMDDVEKKNGKKAWVLTDSGEKEVEKGFAK